MRVYTPKSILDIIIKAGFRVFIENNCKPFKILDPAVGTGNIFIGIWKYLRNNGYYDNDISKMIYGIDIDGKALCKLRFRVKKHLGNVIIKNVYKCEYLFEFEDDGFDLIIMNPPFLGGGKISGIFGNDYKKDINKYYGKYRGGMGDLSSYFIRRSYEICSNRAVISLVATNTISQGVTRRVGLQWMVANNWKIYDANRNIKWSNKKVAVTVSTCALCRDFEKIDCYLDWYDESKND